MQNHLENNQLIEIPKKELITNDLIGNYQIVKLLGEGSYGNVYLVENINNGNQYSLKLLKLQESTQEHIQEFNNEIEILRELWNHHNNINNINNNRYVPRLYSNGYIMFKFTNSVKMEVET